MVIFILIISGLMLGSFVNALVWRLYIQGKDSRKGSKPANNNQLSIINGRSVCPKCRHILGAKDLMPVLSWLWLRGKCRYCHKPISVQYPLVEITVMFLFLLSYIYWPYGFSLLGIFEFISWLVFITGFMALTVFDIRWKLLPNKIVYPLICLGIIEVIIISISKSEFSPILGAFFGFLIISGTFYILFQISDGKWLGGGDVKLGALLGILVGGPVNSIILLFLASLSGTLYSIPLIAKGKVHPNSQLPFGPFLIFAAIVLVLFGPKIETIYANPFFW